MRLRFDATIIEWRGPAPFFYAPLPKAEAAEIRAVAKRVTYGWGVIPVEATIGGVAFTTSLFPRDDTYLLPIKAAVRKKTNVTVGDTIAIDMMVGPAQR
jgi:hypothetical protein